MFKKSLAFLVLFAAAGVASADMNQFWFVVNTPIALGVKVLNSTISSSAQIYPPTCSGGVNCSFSVQTSQHGYYFSVTLGPDMQHSCQFRFNVSAAFFGQNPVINLMSTPKSDCKGGMTFQSQGPTYTSTQGTMIINMSKH